MRILSDVRDDHPHRGVGHAASLGTTENVLNKIAIIIGHRNFSLGAKLEKMDPSMKCRPPGKKGKSSQT